MATELKCPFCGGEAAVNPFIYKILEMPKPIKLFGRWTLLKMRYRDIPIKYAVECNAFCDGFAESDIFAVGESRDEAIEAWNRRAADGK